MSTGLHIQLSAVAGMTRRGYLPSPITIPVVVNEEFIWSKEGGHAEYDTIGEGSFSSPMGGVDAPKLAQTNFDAMTLTWNPAYMAGPGYDPEDLIQAFEDITDARTPFLLFGWLPDMGTVEFDKLATLRRMEVRLKHGETDTRYVTLEFSEYRQPKLVRLGRGHQGGNKRRPKLPAKHKLEAGDTLRSLSRHYYLTQNRWGLIAVWNGIRNWGADDELVKSSRYKPGDIITIPDWDEQIGISGGNGTGGITAP